MKQNERREWRELKSRLFGPASPARGADAFVSAVMARIPEEKNVSLFERFGLWFNVPVMAFAAAMLFVFAPRYQEEPAVSTAMVLMGERVSDPLSLALIGEEVPVQEVIGYSTEGL